MIIKFIETDKTAQFGDLVKSKRGWIGIFGEHEDSYEDECTALLPFGISDKAPTYGDTYIDTIENKVYIMGHHKLYSAPQLKKVEFMPERFEYQQIINFRLNDGDNFCWYNYGGNASKITLMLCTKITSTKSYQYEKLPMNPNPNLPNWMNGKQSFVQEELRSAFDAARLYEHGELLYDDFEEWFDKNKKPQNEIILKLVETNEAPKVRDLVKLKSGKLVLAQLSNDGFIGWYTYLGVKGGIMHVHFKEGDKVVRPYGISNEKIKLLDNYIFQIEPNDWVLMECYEQDEADRCNSRFKNISKKVAVLPEMFNYQDIIALCIKDGDSLKLTTERQDTSPYYKAGGGPEDDTQVLKLNDEGKVIFSKSAYTENVK
jgi:hypothetical protein